MLCCRKSIWKLKLRRKWVIFYMLLQLDRLSTFSLFLNIPISFQLYWIWIFIFDSDSLWNALNLVFNAQVEFYLLNDTVIRGIGHLTSLLLQIWRVQYISTDSQSTLCSRLSADDQGARGYSFCRPRGYVGHFLGFDLWTISLQLDVTNFCSLFHILHWKIYQLPVIKRNNKLYQSSSVLLFQVFIHAQKVKVQVLLDT